MVGFFNLFWGIGSTSVDDIIGGIIGRFKMKTKKEIEKEILGEEDWFRILDNDRKIEMKKIVLVNGVKKIINRTYELAEKEILEKIEEWYLKHCGNNPDENTFACMPNKIEELKKQITGGKGE